MIDVTLRMLPEEAALLVPLFELHAQYVEERLAADDAMDQGGIDWALTADQAILTLMGVAMTEGPDFNDLRDHVNGPEMSDGYFATPAGFMALCEARTALPQLDSALQPQSY
jgi:hypothetical protein